MQESYVITVSAAVAAYGTRYRVAKVCGVHPATVYGSWGEVVPRKHWQRLVAESGGRLTMPAGREGDQAA